MFQIPGFWSVGEGPIGECQAASPSRKRVLGKANIVN